MNKYAEKVLVVPRKILFSGKAPQGFLPATRFDSFEIIISDNMQFHARSEMEQDPTYKQIINYYIFSCHNKYFLMRRRETASEDRLKNKYSLGIGGHLRQEDVAGVSIASWGWREFVEEVSYQGNVHIKPLGLVNDESNAVGQVHTGFVFLLEGDQEDISVKSELKEGFLVSIDELETYFDHMEPWSQLVFSYLKTVHKGKNS
jgi:predicted NUDIX family phosphoesterase